MEQFKVFTALYHICELRSREDLVKGIIQNLNYNFDGHSRIVLSKVLTSTYKNIRLFATNHLGELIRQSPHANAWTLRLLLTQLYDTCTEVCEATVHFLEEACESMEILQLVVEMQPTVDHLGEIGHPLLLKFMSTAMGFRYLFDAGYIDREMDMWLNERNIIYVIQVEIFLAKVFGYSSPSDEDLDILAFDGIVPPHFYGEMSKTELGCQVLQEKGHFVEFAHFIRRHGLESADPELILKLKSILWAVGNIGATDGGLPFLEEEEIIPAILDIAEQSPIPSVRGTCFFILGLISSTSQGAEILDDYHWEATLSPLGTPTGLCIPVDVEKFVSMPPWNPPPARDDSESRLLSPTTQTELEVITAIQNLGNTVIANAASRSLTRMKSRPEYRPVFLSPLTFYRALHTISTQRYRLPVRRYILDLFNIELDTDVVKSLTDCAKSLRAPPSYKQLKSPSTRVVSMFGRLGRSRRASDSDDDDDASDTAENDTIVIDEKPVVALRPVSRIIGFDS
jgi:large subunit ribosomal protein L17e